MIHIRTSTHTHTHTHARTHTHTHTHTHTPEQVMELRPDLDGAGSTSEGAAAAVASLLLPAAVAAYESTLSAVFTAGAEDKRRAKEALAKVCPSAKICKHNLLSVLNHSLGSSTALYALLHRLGCLALCCIRDTHMCELRT